MLIAPQAVFVHKPGFSRRTTAGQRFLRTHPVGAARHPPDSLSLSRLIRLPPALRGARLRFTFALHRKVNQGFSLTLAYGGPDVRPAAITESQPYARHSITISRFKSSTCNHFLGVSKLASGLLYLFQSETSRAAGHKTQKGDMHDPKRPENQPAGKPPFADPGDEAGHRAP